MYEIILTNEAKKQLSRLPENIKNRIGSVFERIKINPFRHVKRKAGTPYFILRIGDYRAILDIEQKKLIIYVIEIGIRGRIYEK